MKKAVEIFDSTLRDGAQGEGISFSVEDKLHIVTALDELGVKFIEAGNPGSNPKDLEFFERAKNLSLTHSRLVAFGSTRRKGIRVEEDANCRALLEAQTNAVAVFGKCWDLHVLEILQTTLEENLAMIEDTCAFFKKEGKEVFFDAEHFIDGWKNNRGYALDALKAAVRGGADCLVLCDTNGGSFPHEVQEAVRLICKTFPGQRIGIHCHNDCGMAVANSVLAVQAGACHVQGTFLGFGERCGNTNLSTMIPDLQIKLGYRCIPDDNIQNLTATARRVAEIANVTLHKNVPFVGHSAFAHKAGMHADGVLKNTKSFEHINPETVGNERRFLMSEIAGRTAVLRKINKICPAIHKDSPQTYAIMEELKSKEHMGYQYEGADGSFQLVIRRVLGLSHPFFSLISYKILGELPTDNGHGDTATLKLNVGGQTTIAAAEGDGPVNALDLALREALRDFYPCLNKIHLIDYKVRVMEPRDATAAMVRVLITTTDGTDVWTTVGVSCDIIEASWIALVDSVEYKLYQELEKHPEDFPVHLKF